MPANSSRPFVSVCIPAYKRPENVRRLLKSLSSQTFQDFEIVLTDDSPDDSVEQVSAEFLELNIRYLKNKIALGPPANWNYGLDVARGEWVKIIHDDDWLAENHSLEQFCAATEAKNKFIVSRYRNVFESGRAEKPGFPASWHSRILKNPVALLANNVIGPPSVTMVHSSIKERYDIRMKWRVDMDYYMRILFREKSFHLVDQVLINVGISESQVTNSCINRPEVELPEGKLLLEKYGTAPLNDMHVYDAWWRILRNVGVRTEKDLSKFTPGTTWPAAIRRMAASQSHLPAGLLKFGPFSKLAMAANYLLNRG